MSDTPRPAPGAAAPAAGLEVRLRALAEEAAVDSGLYVVGVSVKGHPGSRVVEVFADGGGIDEIAGLTRRINFLLDLEDPVAGRYRLDVSTPGADRPLVDLRQYPQHVGRTLRVTHGAEGTEPAQTTGTLTDATPDAITLDVDGEALVVPVADLRKALVVLPW